MESLLYNFLFATGFSSGDNALFIKFLFDDVTHNTFLYFSDIEKFDKRQPSDEAGLQAAFNQAKDALKMRPDERLDRLYACGSSEGEDQENRSQSSDDDSVKVIATVQIDFACPFQILFFMNFYIFIYFKRPQKRPVPSGINKPRKRMRMCIMDSDDENNNRNGDDDMDDDKDGNMEKLIFLVGKN